MSLAVGEAEASGTRLAVGEAEASGTRLVGACSPKNTKRGLPTAKSFCGLEFEEDLDSFSTGSSLRRSRIAVLDVGMVCSLPPGLSWEIYKVPKHNAYPNYTCSKYREWR
jgi:hypothetical protein